MTAGITGVAARAARFAGAFALVVGLAACAASQPRYPIQPDPLGAGTAGAGSAAPIGAAPPPAAVATVPFEPATPAPSGAVQSASLPPLAQVAPPPTAVVPAPGPAPSAVDPAAATLSHVVQPGDTFYAIGRRYGVSPRAIAELNGLTFESVLRIGQRVQLPVGAVDKGPQAALPPAMLLAAMAAPVAALARATVVEPEPPVVQEAPPPAATPSPAGTSILPPEVTQAPPPPPLQLAPSQLAPSQIAPSQLAPGTAGSRLSSALTPPTLSPPTAASRVGFVWPLHGQLLSGFGPKGPGQRSDGLTIAATEGASVRAAAAGEVAYAGDQVPQLGKLVLLKHPDGWVTAYAHLSEIKVRIKDRVPQNGELGLAGRTGSAAAPQLYFEVRRSPSRQERARPVDPMPLLPPL